MTQRATLCHRCRKIIGSSESICSWCGASRPSAPWKTAVWTRGALDGDWLVKAIITVTIGYYLFSLILSGMGNPRVSAGSLTPDQTSLLILGATGVIPIDRFGHLWSLLTANYLHGGILHIIFNIMALRQIAPWVINEYGASRMFIIYTLGGACGFWVSYLAGIPLTIGASAGICGLIGSLLYYGKSRGGGYGAAVFREVKGWVIGLVLFGLLLPSINNWGHGGGILGGILLGFLLGYEERTSESGVHRLIALACGAVTVAALGWASLGAARLWIGI